MRPIKNNMKRITDSKQAGKLKALGLQKVGSTATETVGSEDRSPDKVSVAKLRSPAEKEGMERVESLTETELLTVLKDVTMDD